ncbi:MAG TPA: STAS domain-containing protein [Solirubrobacterales bacterium]
MPVPPASSTLSRGPLLGAPPLFSCTRMAEGRGSIRLVLAGELDLSARGHFEQALRDAQSDASRVVLDLQALTLIDCASLSVAFDAAIEARRHDLVLILLDPRGQVRRVLDLTGAPDGVAVLERSDAEPMTVFPNERFG